MGYIDDESGNIRAYLQEAAEMERNAADHKEQASSELASPFYLVRAKLLIDGNKWCALYGDNMQDGVAGFGGSPNEAVQDFNKEWYKKLMTIT